MQKTILLVEDEKEIQQAIQNFLIREQYNVLVANNGKEAMEQFSQQKIDLILLDMMMPVMGGEEVLKEIRKKSDVPIIIISALDDELIQQDAFIQSVDDYVIKPFSIQILMYKIAALMRRVYGLKHERLVWNDIEVITNNYEVYKNKEEVTLTAKEFDLLQVLMTNIGKVYTREQLLTLVWGYDYYGDDRIIDVHIKNIRKKLDSKLVKTIKGIGYKVERA